MQKTTSKPLTMKPEMKPEIKKEMKKENITRNALKVQRGKYDLQQFREELKAELADKSNKSSASCASTDPTLLNRVVQAHLSELPDQPIQRQQVEQGDKHQHGSKRAMTQAEATASLK